MRPVKTASVEELQAIGRFESLQKILRSETYVEHLDKPLAYWALPTDRRLPLAFLSRSLRELLGASFEELAKTPGIGQKKMKSFVKLLARVANTDPADLPTEINDFYLGLKKSSACDPNRSNTAFDPAAISELQWEQCRASVVRHGLGQEKIGRFAPSLQNITKVVWNTPLEAYIGFTLAEIQAMKTHGKRRLNAILEVFYNLHTLVANMEGHEHLALRAVPRLIDRVEQWIGQSLQKPGLPDNGEIFQNFVSPLLEQIRIDAPQQIVTMAENRLGVRGPITSVRQVARTMGLTRARVYQLLNEINDIMTVRWPLGRHQVYELRDKFAAEAVDVPNPPSLVQFHAAVELFYPGSRRGADGPLEKAADIYEEEIDLLEVSRADP
ncbi:MAG: hypothetical protein ABSA16_09930 [Thermoguttaceae bacterium]|jgi:hypothetical protein